MPRPDGSGACGHALMFARLRAASGFLELKMRLLNFLWP
jgi:hypothetical protein